MQVTILGNSSGGPFHGRHYTAQIVRVGQQPYLIDCGEGTQMQIFKYRLKFDRCNHFFISHLHGDHVFGLMGLITNWSLKKRTETLHLFSPPGLQELIETTIRVCGVRLSYALEFHEVAATKHALVFETPQLEVWTIPLNHRSPTTGWLFREKPRPRNIRPEAIAQYALTHAQIRAAKAGKDLLLENGQTLPNADITLAPKPPGSYAFCSDTAYSEEVIAAVQGVDLLYHEATFTESHVEEAALSFHSTATQAAEVAKRAQVQDLILGHISGRYSDTEGHLAEAKVVFDRVSIAEEGSVWEV